MFGVILLTVLISTFAQSVVITDQSGAGLTLANNAVNALGSDCWSRGKKDEALFLKFISAVTGAETGFKCTKNPDNLINMVRNQRRIGANLGKDWELVTGAVNVGDLIVGRSHINIVVQRGRVPVIIKDGKKVDKKKDPAAYDEVYDLVKDSWDTDPGAGGLGLTGIKCGCDFPTTIPADLQAAYDQSPTLLRYARPMRNPAMVSFGGPSKKKYNKLRISPNVFVFRYLGTPNLSLSEFCCPPLAK